METSNLVLVSLLLNAFSTAAAIQPFYGLPRAEGGDSPEVNGVRVRLYGIDASEFDQMCRRNGAQWACGAEATDRLSRLVTGREIRCVPDGMDQYDRVLFSWWSGRQRGHGRSRRRCRISTIFAGLRRGRR